MKKDLLGIADLSRDEIYRILRRLQRQRQTTLVVVTHDRRFITPDDMVLEIQDGQLAGATEAADSADYPAAAFSGRQ